VTGHHGDALFPDYWVVKIDFDGELQWEKSFGGTGFDVATGACKHRTEDTSSSEQSNRVMAMPQSISECSDSECRIGN